MQKIEKSKKQLLVMKNCAVKSVAQNLVFNKQTK